MRRSSAARPARSRATRLVVVLALLAGACAGPRKPVHIGAKTVTLDVLLGGKKAVAGAPVPPARFVLGPSGFPVFSFGVDAFPPRPRPPRIPPTCIDQNAVPADSLPWALMPLPGRYTYRAAGSFKVGGANPSEHGVPEKATVEVLDTRITTDTLGLNLYWKLAVTLDGVTTTTAYRSSIPLAAHVVADGQLRDGIVYPKPPDERPLWPQGDLLRQVPAARGVATVPPYPAPPTSEFAQPPRGVHFGLFIESVETRPVEGVLDAADDGPADDNVPTGAVALFRPAAPGLLLAKYPLEVSSAFDVTGGDGETTMSYRATVRPKATVRSCFLALDTWTIELTRGVMTDARTGEAVEFTARYQLATGLGGLFVDDFVEVKGQQVAPGSVVPIVRTLATTFENFG